MGVTAHLKDTKNWLQGFFIKVKKKTKTTFRCGVSNSSKEAAFILINQVNEKPELVLSETFATQNNTILNKVITDIVKEHNLYNVPTHWILGPDEYQIFLIDSMQVLETEFREALSWRIRSLISYPIEEAVIDYFFLPGKKTIQENPMVAAVVAQANQLTKNIDAIKNSGLSIEEINIPELAMRNLTALYETDEKSTAFIYFADNIAILNISREEILYFTRRIPWTKPTVSSPSAYEQIALEILRYFDYFQSQWRHPNPSRIFIAIEKEEMENACSTLSDYLSNTVEAFSLSKIIPSMAKVSGDDKQLLLTLGSMLGESTYVTTRD